MIQDVRGRYTSEGNFDPYRNEGRDGFDTDGTGRRAALVQRGDRNLRPSAIPAQFSWLLPSKILRTEGDGSRDDIFHAP